MAVLIYTENWDGSFKKFSYELISYGKKIAEQLNLQTVVLSLGPVDSSVLKNLGNYGADKILNVADGKYKVLDNRAFTEAIKEAVEFVDAKVVLMAHNNTGKALAPRLAVKLKAAYGSALIAPPVSYDPFVVRKKVLSGKAFAQIRLDTDIKVITLSQNSFGLVESENKAAIEAFDPSPDDSLFSTQVTDVQKQTGKVILTDAEIVVSGGRGMKSPDNWGPIEELAGLLGAATACSRPVSDEGWRPASEHTGQTGKNIAPNLYIAAGISGAIQHLAGVSSSRYIVAINTDKDAPIFEAADYGIVGDAMKVLPALVEAVKEIKTS